VPAKFTRSSRQRRIQSFPSRLGAVAELERSLIAERIGNGICMFRHEFSKD
jgi:hypothetical protein